MAAAEYTLDKIEASRRQAKLATLNNRLLGKKWQLPAVMFDVGTEEEMGAVRRYYFEGRPAGHVFGFTVHLSGLPTMAPLLRAYAPANLTLLCDIETELFWHGNVKEAVHKFHRRHTITADAAREAVQRVNAETTLPGKIRAHRDAWDGLLKDQRLLAPMLTRYVDLQNAHQADILCALGPLLPDAGHVDMLEECFALTRSLYGGLSAGPGSEGRQLALYANLHTNFLAKARNVPELAAMIERAAPEAVVFKVFNLEDIRKKPAFAENYNALIRSLSSISQSMGMPVVYLSAHTEGYRANLLGIDAFSEPFGRPVSTMRERGGAGAAPVRGTGHTVLSGRVYDIQTGDFVTREEFEGTRLTEEGISSPVPGVAGVDPGRVRAMTDSAFREFAKALLIESRNYEVAQLHEGIRADNIDPLWLKADRWMGTRGGR